MTVFNAQRSIIHLVAALLVLGFGLAVPARGEPGNDNRAPDLSEFTILKAPAGYKIACYAYGEGVQIYRWNGVSWVFVRPEAVLYANEDAEGVVGIHYIGPTWESNSGSYVVGSVLQRYSPNPSAIPWLLLKAVESDGPGVFDGITYIQRVHTVGGLAPTAPGDTAGQEAKVPYT